MKKGSWEDNNILREGFFDETKNFIAKFEDKAEEAIKSNSDFLAKLFREKFAEYLWGHYNIDELDTINLNNIALEWLKKKSKK